MICTEPDGALTFTLCCPEADTVEVVGDFFGYGPQRHTLDRSEDGLWHLRLHPPPGVYLFRYLINGTFWVLDGSAPTTYSAALDCETNRIGCPAVHDQHDQHDRCAA